MQVVPMTREMGGGMDGRTTRSRVDTLEIRMCLLLYLFYTSPSTPKLLCSILTRKRMCFFEQTVWPCGFWRWGKFRQQCTKEYRIGETCGLKLVYKVNHSSKPCIICRDIVRKNRRIIKMSADVARWRQAQTFPATIEKTERQLDDLRHEVLGLTKRHMCWSLSRQCLLVGETI